MARHFYPIRLVAPALIVAGLVSGCGAIDVDDGITETGALSTAGLQNDPAPETTPETDVALDFTTGDEDADSEAAALREGRPGPPDPTPTRTRKKDDDEEQSAVGRSEIEDVENDSEVLIARGTYHADVKDGTALKVRKEPEGKKIESITNAVPVKATGEGQTIAGITWAQIRPLGDAEWDIGWVVFDHLKGGDPDADPTPTLEPTEDTDDADPTATPKPSETDPAPTRQPAPPADSTEDDQVEDTDSPEEEDGGEETDEGADEETESESNGDGSSQEISGMGELFVISGDADLHADADPSSSVVAVANDGADAVIASNTVYRYGGSTYIQVNVEGTLGWIRVDQLRDP